MSLPAVFITSATGAQGGALARQLRALNYPVHATTRDLSSPSALALASIGVIVTQATSWDDEPALRAAMTGCTKLFLNLMLSPPPLDSELVTGKQILRIAREVGVDHVVYTSSAYTTHMAEMKSMQEGSIVWWTTNAKRLLEDEVKKAGDLERWTILRPGFFMQNFVGANASFMYADFLKTGVWVTGIPAETPIPLIDTEDIGRFAAKAFLEPDRYTFREVDLASEYRTPGEVVEALRRVSGKEMRVEVLEGKELEEVEKKDMFVGAQKAVGDLGRVVDLDVVRGYGVPLGTFEEFLQREREAVNATYRQLPARK